MNPKDYIQKALRTATHDYENIGKRLQDADTISLLHAGIGLTTEGAEFLDAVKKHVYYGKQLDKVNLIEEISDVFWFCAIACNTLGVSFEEVMAKNIAKLEARYPNGFTEDKAENRDLAKERKILEVNPKIKEIAKRFDKIQYGDIDHTDLLGLLKPDNLVVVYGASDDLCELRGAIDEEYGAYEGTTLVWGGKKFISADDEDEEQDAEDMKAKGAFFIRQIWCPDDEKSWGFQTNIPNAEKFIVMEDNDMYGEGLIFSMDDLK